MLGANGAGKTTLLKTVSGVMDPAKGDILLAGDTIAGRDPDRIVRKGVVHVPEGREIFPLLTVDENLAMGAYTRKDRDVDEDREMVFGYFPILKQRLRQTAGTLSGGQQQMLAIARGLMAGPRVMLLDEPSLGLSPCSWATSSPSSAASTPSAASPCCWWSRMPGWRWISPMTATSWNSGAS